MANRLVFAQTDFGGGQVDEDAHLREDAKVAKTAARLAQNWRQRNTGTLQVRPGRSAVALTTAARAERFRMSAAQELIIAFPTNGIEIRDSAGNLIINNFTYTYLWTTATSNLINWTVTPDRLVVCFPGMQPQLVLWNSSANTFSFAAFSFRTIGGQVNEPFLRTAALGATMYPGGFTGTITISCSVPYFTNAMIGQLLSLAGQQVQIIAVGSATPIATCTAIVFANLNLTFSLSVDNKYAIPAHAMFPLNSVAETSETKMSMEIAGVTFTGNTSWAIFGTVLNGVATVVIPNEALVSAFGAAVISAGPGGTSGFQTAGPPAAMVTWAHEFMNSTNWPSACFFAEGRLGFCDFPGRPDAVLFSAVGLYDVFFIDAAAALTNQDAGTAPASAILEFISGQPHVRNVVEWNGDVFSFTDKGVYWTSTGGSFSQAGTLSPGTVQFRLVTDASCSAVKPLVTRDAVIFTSASGDRVSAIVRTGNFTTPYVEQDLTIYHSALVKSPVTIAIGHGDDGFPERYIYVVNNDGTVAVGRVQDDRSFVGWLPWTGAGLVKWISSALFDVLFVTVYGTQAVLELEAAASYLDCQVLYNSPPANMLSSGHAFSAFANGTLRVMDGAIDYGLRNVSAAGDLVKNPEDDFSSATVVAGTAFISQFKPFLEEAPRGQAVMQRQRRRKITRAAVSVYGSSGFSFGGRTVPPFDFGQNPFAQPTLKETTYRARFLGRDFDPQVLLTKDAPGPLVIVEFVQEATI